MQQRFEELKSRSDELAKRARGLRNKSSNPDKREYFTQVIHEVVEQSTNAVFGFNQAKAATDKEKQKEILDVWVEYIDSVNKDINHAIENPEHGIKKNPSEDERERQETQAGGTSEDKPDLPPVPSPDPDALQKPVDLHETEEIDQRTAGPKVKKRAESKTKKDKEKNTIEIDINRFKTRR